MKAYTADHSVASGVSLGERPEPVAGPGVAVVRVDAASLNRGEVLHVRKYRLVPHGAPVGWDLAGVVVEAAPDGDGPDVGSRVFGWCQPRGSWAERVAVRVEHLAIAPDDLSAIDASTLGVAALTAFAALARRSGQLIGAHVLITGATGGVGQFAVQLARAAGAKVTAVVRSGVDMDALGTMFPNGVAIEAGPRPDGAPADLIIESVGGASLSHAMDRVAPGGTIVTLGRTSDEPAQIPAGWFHKNAFLEGFVNSRQYSLPGSTTDALQRMAAMVCGGTLRTGVELVVPADRLTEGMDALFDRLVRGKVVVSWVGD